MVRRLKDGLSIPIMLKTWRRCRVESCIAILIIAVYTQTSKIFLVAEESGKSKSMTSTGLSTSSRNVICNLVLCALQEIATFVRGQPYFKVGLVQSLSVLPCRMNKNEIPEIEGKNVDTLWIDVSAMLSPMQINIPCEKLHHGDRRTVMPQVKFQSSNHIRSSAPARTQWCHTKVLHH